MSTYSGPSANQSTRNQEMKVVANMRRKRDPKPDAGYAGTSSSTSYSSGHNQDAVKYDSGQSSHEEQPQNAGHERRVPVAEYDDECQDSWAGFSNGYASFGGLRNRIRVAGYRYSDSRTEDVGYDDPPPKATREYKKPAYQGGDRR